MHIGRYECSTKSALKAGDDDDEEDAAKKEKTTAETVSRAVGTMTLPLCLHRPKTNTMNATKISKQCTDDVKCAYLHSIRLFKNDLALKGDREIEIEIEVSSSSSFPCTQIKRLRVEMVNTPVIAFSHAN